MSCKFSLSNRKCFKHLEIHSSPKNIVNSQIKKKLLLQLWTYCLKRNLFSVTSIAHYKQLFNVFDNLKKKAQKNTLFQFHSSTLLCFFLSCVNEFTKILKTFIKILLHTWRFTNVWLLHLFQKFFFFNWVSLHARLNSHYEAWSYKKKSIKKITGYRKSV